ncbi:hypothetical protein T09_5670 [Trichinella sp. T9]|nr:hypothetical protein T09_5670 [Trichinella sp. T9]
MNSKEFNEMIVFLMIPNVRKVYDRLSGKSSCPKQRNIEQECAN